MQLYVPTGDGTGETEDLQVRAVDSLQKNVARGFIATVEPEGVVEIISNDTGEVFTIRARKEGDFLITLDDGVHRTRLAGEVIKKELSRVMISTRGPVLQSDLSPQDAGMPGSAIVASEDGEGEDGVRGNRPVETHPR